MNRNFWLFILSLCVAGQADAQGFSLLGGVTQNGRPVDGTYWNANQQNSMQLTTPSAGLRWDSERLIWNTSAAVQYTYHGTAKTDAMAVTVDAPLPGGYIEGSAGQCIGPCAPLAQWKMQTRTQSVAFTGSKHFGNWSVEAGLSVFNAITSGTVNYQDGRRYHYKTHNYIGVNEVFGVAYQRGNFSVRLQKWYFDGRIARDEGGVELPPAVFGADKTYSLLIGYKFWE